jgi:hypothetical protein
MYFSTCSMDSSLCTDIRSQKKRLYTPDTPPLQIEKATAQTETASSSVGFLVIAVVSDAELPRLCLKTPSSARERAFFRPTEPVPSNAEGTEAGDIGCIVDGAPDVHRDSQAENKPLEARSCF